MKFLRCFVLLLPMSVTCLLISYTAEREPEDKLAIEGYVVDSDGVAITSVRVLLIQASGKLRTGTTDKEGHYKIEIPDSSINLLDLRFDHDDAGKAVITRLCGKRRHIISVVLFRKKQIAKMTPTALADELFAYEHTAYYASVGPPEVSSLMSNDLKKVSAFERFRSISEAINSLKEAPKKVLMAKQIEVERIVKRVNPDWGNPRKEKENPEEESKATRIRLDNLEREAGALKQRIEKLEAQNEGLKKNIESVDRKLNELNPKEIKERIKNLEKKLKP